MEQNIPKTDYREHLLSALRSDRRSRPEDEGGSLHVFVDQEGIGTLGCAGRDSALVFESRERPLHLVELRTESGRLVGGLCMPESGTKAVRLRVGTVDVEVSVEAADGRGTVRAVSHQARPELRRVQDMVGGLAADIRDHVRGMVTSAPGNVARGPVAPSTSLWAAAGVLAQVGLVVTVLFLLGDRMIDAQKTEERDAQVARVGETLARQEAASAGTAEALARQERLLRALTSSQAEVRQALRAQKREMAGLHRVEDKLEQLGRARASFDASVVARLNDAAAERAQMGDRIRVLTAANEELNREVAQLRVRTVVTEARLANQVQSFQFWVSFQDGVPEERIDQWVKEIRGHIGPVNAGWYNVEIDLPQSQSKDRLLKTFQQETDIVKAVSLRPATPEDPKSGR